MSRHWHPSGKIVRIRPVRGKRLRGLGEFDGPWTRAGDYLDRDVAAPRRVVPFVLGAVLLGLVAAGVVSWTGKSVRTAKSDAPIEWNAVQAVPTRTPDAQDIAWQQRALEQDSPSTGSGRAVEVVRGSGEPTASAARNSIYVIDGDTFAFGGQRIRIAGIDAPETHPPRCMEEARLGLAATAKLKQLLGSGTVTISGSGHDRYGRELREVRVNGQDVGEAMISAAVARSYAGAKRQGWC